MMNVDDARTSIEAHIVKRAGDLKWLEQLTLPELMALSATMFGIEAERARRAKPPDGLKLV